MFNKRIKTEDNRNINEIIGSNLRYIRTLSGKTQTRLGKELNITFQQVQKYEAGKNGMSAYRIYKAAKFLNVPMDALFDPNFIKSMRAIHQADALTVGPKPSGFFNVYAHQRALDHQLHADLHTAKYKGERLTEKEEEFLRSFDESEQ
jgi:transcriptional regulator with XRE-family HTH domain